VKRIPGPVPARQLLQFRTPTGSKPWGWSVSAAAAHPCSTTVFAFRHFCLEARLILDTWFKTFDRSPLSAAYTDPSSPPTSLSALPGLGSRGGETPPRGLAAADRSGLAKAGGDHPRNSAADQGRSGVEVQVLVMAPTPTNAR